MTGLDLGRVCLFATRRLIGSTGLSLGMQQPAEEITMDGSVDSLVTVIDRSTREQYRFLDFCVGHGIAVTVFLSSGANYTGIVIDHDRTCILLGSTSTTRPKDPKVFMKGYIALIRPNVAIELFIQYRGMGTALKRKKAQRNAKTALKKAMNAQKVRIKPPALECTSPSVRDIRSATP